MAGGTNPKGSSVKPSSTSSAAPPRKSRWEPASNNHPTTTKPPANDPKPSKSYKDQSPKTGPTPSPANVKPPHSGATSASASVPSPGVPFPFPDPAAMGPPPPPVYGFHMLERRTIVLADGSVRSYFALPPDYQDFPPTGRFLPLGPGGGPMPEMGGFDRRFPPGGAANPGVFNLQQDYWNSLGLDGRGGEGSMKRKFGEEEEKDRRRDGNPNGVTDGTSVVEDLRASKHMRTSGGYDNGGYREIGGSGVEQVNPKYLEVDQNELKKAFLRFAKLINENSSQKKSFLENGKHGRVQCLACSSSSSTSSGRSSKDFTDTHSLVMHTYYSTNADLRVDHLGLHKALCVLMGWNYSKSPENSKTYQVVSAEEAAANRDDLIIWPPMVIIHNTITAKNKDGRMEGMGNKLMDTKIRELGFPGGKSKSLYGREGHLGMTLVKFASDQAGLKEAIRLAEHFDEDNRGRKAWALLQPLTIGTKDDENNPRLMTLDPRTHNKRRVLYGYLGTASDVDKLDYETKKKVVIESYREYKNSSK